MEKAERILILVILALAVIDTAAIYFTTGLSWDFAVNAMNARDDVSLAFYSYMLAVHPSHLGIATPVFYAETFRDPLMPLIMSYFTIFLQSYAPIAYQLFVIFFLFAALFFFSRTTKTSLLMLVLLFFTPYVLFWVFLLDGEEGISLILMIFAMALLMKKKWQSGIALGLVGLAKYPSLIFLPLILLLPGRREKLYALASFVLVSLPFLIGNWLYYGNPLEAYITEMYLYSVGSMPASGVLLESLFIIFSFLVPAALLLIALLATRKGNAREHALRIDHYQKVLLAAIALGTIGWLYLARYPALDGTPRMGYLMYVGVALEFGLLFSRFGVGTLDLNGMHTALEGKLRGAWSRLAVPALSAIAIASLAGSLIVTLQLGEFGAVGTNWIGFTGAANALAQHGFANCSVISNAWVYLYYDHVIAHDPSLNNTNSSLLPRLVYQEGGTAPSSVYIPPGSKVYNYTYFSLVLPPNASCFG